MSVCYRMEYSVVIAGTRAEFERIPEIVREATKDFEDHYSHFWDPFIGGAERALEAGTEPMLLRAESSDGDDSHGIMEAILNALDETLPELEIAAAAVYVDVEYTGGELLNILYSPKGERALCAECGMTKGRMDVLPDEDWLPYGWRHPGKGAPAAKADGAVALLGDWSEAEKAIVDKALMGGALEAMDYTAFEKGGEAVTQTGEGWKFHVGGKFNAAEAVQSLHGVLLPYIKEHKGSYAALCKAMREKKLAIHLYLDESTGPNVAWSYASNSAWHFLVTSDGTRLRSHFTWRHTYSSRFVRWNGAVSGEAVYEHITKKKWDELSGEGQSLVSWAVSVHTDAYDLPDFEAAPCYEEVQERLWYYDIALEDVLSRNPDLDWLGEEAVEELNKVCAPLQALMDDYYEPLVPVMKEAEALTQPVRFVPQVFDQRFAGKTFVVKGELDGYARGQVKALIEKFGGKVGRNVTGKTAYFVCGRGVENDFLTALKRGTPILCADYFEDMTR